MRMLLVLSAVGVLLGACRVSGSEVTETRRGEAYAQVSEISRLAVLPVQMPDTISGSAQQQNAEMYWEAWPGEGAAEISKGVNAEVFLDVRAEVAESQPQEGFYFELRITRLELADPDIVAADPTSFDQDGWSQVDAVGKIIDASTGELVVELKFHESSGGGIEESFHNDMYAIGEELAEWLEYNQR